MRGTKAVYRPKDRPVSFRLTLFAFDRLREMARRWGVSRSDAVEALVRGESEWIQDGGHSVRDAERERDGRA